MRFRVSQAIAATLLLVVLPALPAVTELADVKAAAAAAADAKLRALYTAEWEWRQKEMLVDPEEEASSVAYDRLPRVDAASQAARLKYWSDALAQLDQIPLSQLSPEEKVNAQVFRAVLEGFIDDQRFKTYEIPLTSDTFFWTSYTPRQGFRTAEEYRSYLGRLSDLPRFFDESIANMRSGLARGYTLPRTSITGREATIEPYLKGDDSNPLYVPFTVMPSGLPADERNRLQRQARVLIAERLVPAYRKLLTFIRDEYLPKARTSIAASSLPGGNAYYQAMIEKFTTLRLSAVEIHEIGLREVARIKADMQALMLKAGFKGTLPEFIRFLRTDPQFYAKTPQELLGSAAYIVKRADLKLKDTIGLLPRFRHGLLPVPEALAPIYTGGRGGLETCMFNTYNLPARPLYALPALVLHECTPGHSFQFALAFEGPARPPFRKAVWFSGYTEGWGLYTEWLGTTMGIYETPYEEFGRSTYEMWRAVRLVVDTGIHHFGWSRQKALEYMKSNVALSEHEIQTEVDRYIAVPGQAVSYKLGELQIRRHRREAEAALGSKFDQRKFTMQFSRWALCHCRYWKSAWPSSSPMVVRTRCSRI